MVFALKKYKKSSKENEISLKNYKNRPYNDFKLLTLIILPLK
jgi:hypothetical protein